MAYFSYLYTPNLLLVIAIMNGYKPSRQEL